MTIRTWIHLRCVLTLVIILKPIAGLLAELLDFDDDVFRETCLRLCFLDMFISLMLDGVLPSDNITTEYIESQWEKYLNATFDKRDYDGK